MRTRKDRRIAREKVLARIRAQTAIAAGQAGEKMAQISSKLRLNEIQRTLLEYLIHSGITPGVATRFCSNRRGGFLDVLKSVAYLKSLKIDPKKYGTDKIPTEIIGTLLPVKLTVIKRSHLRRELRKLENQHAEQVLDHHFPNWRKVKTFFIPGSTHRPVTILKHLREHAAAGLEPRTDTIVGSVERAIRRTGGRPLLGTSKILKGSQFQRMPKSERKVRMRKVIALEREIDRLNERLKGTDTEGLDARKRQLIAERDQLLFKWTK